MKNTVNFFIPFKELTKSDRDFVYGASRIALCQRKDGEPGRRYLQVSRGLDIHTIAKFRLGYVPFSIHHEFSGRIVMPIFDMYNNLLGLSVRPIFDILRLKDGSLVTALDLKQVGLKWKFRDENDQSCELKTEEVSNILDVKPKYWNESFAKSEHLFGLNIAKYYICKLGFAIVCEGQFDVMSLHAHGFKNAVGVSGGAFSSIHTMLLARWTDQVIFLFDGDEAGKRFSGRATEATSIYNNFHLVINELDKDGEPKFDRKTGEMITKLKRPDFFKSTAINLPRELDPDEFLRNFGSGVMMRNIRESMENSGMKIFNTELIKKWA